MKISVLGWGSLVWDKRELSIADEWKSGGPVLPIEFSRVSGDGRLTLVIDPIHGHPVTTLFAPSECLNLNDAIANLRERENTSTEKIGYVNLMNNTERDYSRLQHPAACDAIKSWAQGNGWDAVIWTALPSNFELERKVPFTVAAACSYFSSLTGETKARAVEYIKNAPPQVDTPFRRLFDNAQ